MFGIAMAAMMPMMTMGMMALMYLGVGGHGGGTPDDLDKKRKNYWLNLRERRKVAHHRGAQLHNLQALELEAVALAAEPEDLDRDPTAAGRADVADVVLAVDGAGVDGRLVVGIGGEQLDPDPASTPSVAADRPAHEVVGGQDLVGQR